MFYLLNHLIKHQLFDYCLILVIQSVTCSQIVVIFFFKNVYTFIEI